MDSGNPFDRGTMEKNVLAAGNTILGDEAVVVEELFDRLLD